MHQINLQDSLLFYAISQCQPDCENYCESLIKYCDYANRTIPNYSNTIQSYNKLLYLSLITQVNEQTQVTAFGQKIIEQANALNTEITGPWDIVKNIQTILANYKLKSVCSRVPWSEAQYQLGCENYTSSVKALYESFIKEL